MKWHTNFNATLKQMFSVVEKPETYTKRHDLPGTLIVWNIIYGSPTLRYWTPIFTTISSDPITLAKVVHETIRISDF